ncbi:MAG: DUF3800 domain-containing protein [Candidatus Latescibacterota bacterium]
MLYRIYIDEVGNPDLNHSDNPNHRFLSLTGVIIESEHVKSVVFPQLEQLKSKYFDSHPDDPVILHRKEMVNSRPPFESLADETTKIAFNRELLSLLGSFQYSVISVCIDKRRQRDTYTVWRYDPYHYCLAVLLERYIFFLERMGARGDVLSESRGGKEDKRLMESFKRLWNEGTEFVSSEKFQRVITSRELKVKPKSNNISGLQIADILAHSSRNEILLENGYEGIRLSEFAQQIVAILQNKYDKNGGKCFGKKIL